MVLGIVYCFMALLWLGAVFVVSYTIYDCWDIIGWGVSCLLGLVVVVALVEFVLHMVIGVAMIAGCR
nr:MAG TPA: hypothetical protein [Caudoviricetes sp.]